MKKYLLVLVALVGALALACAQSDAPPAAPADDADAPLGRGSGGPEARDEPIAESPGLIDTGGLPAFVFVDQDT
ncbi:MAG: hypothetical protein WD939_01875 [Dehalococcoidia bacterium]